jgi:hypothetical protein
MRTAVAGRRVMVLVRRQSQPDRQAILIGKYM